MTHGETTVLLAGLAAHENHLPILQFGRFLHTLSLVAQGSVRMAFEHRSSSPGRTPAWLTRAVDIQYAGSSVASRGTALNLLAPTLDKTVEEIYLPVESRYETVHSGVNWPSLIREGDTALDLAASAIADVIHSEYDSARFDEPLLKNIGKFESCLNEQFSSAEISSRKCRDRVVRLDKTVVDAAKRMASNRPRPTRARLVGILDMVRISTRNFTLTLDGDSEINGVFNVGNIDEARQLLSTRVLVQGRIVYRSSGRPLRLVADSIEPTTDESGIWSRLPEPVAHSTRMSIADHNSLRITQTSTTGMNAIVGEWPGDETDEEIAQALEMIS